MYTYIYTAPLSLLPVHVVYMYTCVYVYMYTYIYTRNTEPPPSACSIYVYMCICIYVYMYTYIYTRTTEPPPSACSTHVYMYICIMRCICIYVYMCINIYSCTSDSPRCEYTHDISSYKKLTHLEAPSMFIDVHVHMKYKHRRSLHNGRPFLFLGGLLYVY